MPTLDYMILCDYVHLDNSNGKLYILGAGIDQIMAVKTPTSHNAGLALRLLLTSAEVDRKHPIEVIFQDEDGNRLIEITTSVTATRPPGVPPGAPVGAQAALNLGLPLPKLGTYSLVLIVNNAELKSIPLRVVQARQAQPPHLPG